MYCNILFIVKYKKGVMNYFNANSNNFSKGLENYLAFAQDIEFLKYEICEDNFTMMFWRANSTFICRDSYNTSMYTDLF